MLFVISCHHGQPLLLTEERLLKPTIKEMTEGVNELGVTLGWCQKKGCCQRFLYVRNRYKGGWGPLSRIRGNELISIMVRRLKMAKESDWVWGSARDETYRKMKVKVQA